MRTPARLPARVARRLEAEAEEVAERLGPVVRRAVLGGDPPMEDRPGWRVPDPGRSLLSPSPTGFLLSAAVRRHVEPVLGRTLAHVRLHNDALSGLVAAMLGTPGFAIGHHVGFAPGRCAPWTPGGAHLLAHELAHVTQQAGIGFVTVQGYEAGVHEAIERLALSRSAQLQQPEISAVYFGNWMRDYNQVFVPMVSEVTPLEADDVYLFISCLALRKFGWALTPEQFGYYIPAEHMDNPGGLVKPLDLLKGQPKVGGGAPPGPKIPPRFVTRQESVHPTKARVLGAGLFAVDQTGVAAHIRRSNLHAERRLELAVRGGRTPLAMLHLGAALHAVEDLFAHSNWVEIALAKALADDPKLLPAVRGSDRAVFCYTPSVTVGGAPRPVLTTGTFTGGDTVISLHTELANLLGKPLPPPSTKEEVKAQRRFTAQLLKRFAERYRGDARFKRVVKKRLPKDAHPYLDKILSDIDWYYSWLPKLPATVAAAIDKVVYAMTARLMTWARQTVAVHLQSRGIETSIADTPLISSLDELRKQARGQFSDAQIAKQKVSAIKGRTTLKAQQNKETKLAATRVRHLENTPEHIVAGPSHSQLCKDHPNSPFFGLSFAMSVAAVERLGGPMRAAWIETQPDRGRRPYRFPSSEPALDKAHAEAAKKSLGRARTITTTGHETPAEQFDVAKARTTWAGDVRATADAIVAVADAPARAATQLTKLSQLAQRGVARLSGSDEVAAVVVSDALTEVVGALRAATTAARRTGTTLDQRTSLRQTATKLRHHATTIENATTHAAREAANLTLRAYRNQVLDLLVRSPNVDRAFAAAVVLNIDLQINATAPAYWSRQRRVIEGKEQIPRVSDRLQVHTITLPSLDGHPSKRRAVLEESRRILAHPFEDSWWIKPLTDFVKQHPKQVAEMITARNEGYAAFIPPDR